MPVKAGPKKRRARAEEKALREAIEENRLRGKQAVTRRSSKVRSYKYKEPEKKKPARKLSLDPTAEGYSGRNTREFAPWEQALMFAEPGRVLDELLKRQVECEHKALKGEKPLAILGDRTYRTCPDCQAVLRWWGSYTATLQGEWQTLRITGYSMPEWGELFTKDKSLWVFILEEAHAALSDKED